MGRQRYMDWKKLTEEAAEEYEERKREKEYKKVLNTVSTGRF